ncbi:NYN domain-containing protein [Bradyrhizobium sp. SZCCHNR1045]|uniref:NYN domain-containing protein n=1 Tax=Bradyrhizobium sp. SZCCHNR1045 TaxID=3057353 RepID=UPI0029169F1D|nr:NYN domain-containing protein [Bradyrhizobium sp. SZCCHNR1045]
MVDNSNIFIEGQKISAIRKGVGPDAVTGKQPGDMSWRIEFAKLLSYLADGRTIRKAFLVGSRPPPNDHVWEMAKANGFEVITHARDANNKEKAVDTELVARGTLAIATTPTPAVLIIASGDRDFIPLVNIAHELGWTVEMCAFSSSYAQQGEMALAVDKVRPLDGSLDLIGYYAFVWPAKE